MKPACETLSELFPELDPLDYYREIFPAQLMEDEGVFETGKYCGVVISLKEDGRVRRTQVTKGLPQMNNLINSNEFSMTAPVLFAGRHGGNKNARFLTALEFDLDFLRLKKDGELQGIHDFLYQTSLTSVDPFNRLPKPTYVIASSERNLHVVYLLDKPLPMYPKILDSVRNFRRSFIPKLWDSWITEAHNKPQFETSPVQAFRLVGSKTKHGNCIVRCFATGERVSIDYMNQYSSNKITTFKSTLTLKEAKELYPEWYENRIERGLPRHTWQAHEGLYEWWVNRMPEVRVGHRYHYLLCMAAYAQKCGISEERLAKDMAFCRKELDKLSPPDNHLTMADLAKAMQAHKERYRTLPREKISELSGLEINPAERNGRKQSVHMKYLNGTNAVRRSLGEEFATGAPTKEKLIKDFAAQHPEMSNRQLAMALGVSRNTVNKWLKRHTE